MEQPAAKQPLAKQPKATQPKTAQPDVVQPKDKLPKGKQPVKQQRKKKYKPEKDTRPSNELTESEFRERQASIEESCGGKKGYMDVIMSWCAQNPQSFAEVLRDPGVTAARAQHSAEWMASRWSKADPFGDSS